MSDSEILHRRLEAIAYENRFKATLFRWYCFYERAGASSERHGELVIDDFQMIWPEFER